MASGFGMTMKFYAIILAVMMLASSCALQATFANATVSEV